MFDEDTIQLMKDYAREGVRVWNRDVDKRTKERAHKLLGPTRIAQHSTDADITIDTVRGGIKKACFIPMLRDYYHPEIEQCFFLPSKEGDDRASFDLLMLCEEGNCLGFRFEPAGDGTHDYGHVQMNRKMGGDTIAVEGLPRWVPVSYPAFPLRTSDPLQMFLSMATAVHGHSVRGKQKGMNDVLRAILKEPRRAQRYISMLNEFLG